MEQHIQSNLVIVVLGKLSSSVTWEGTSVQEQNGTLQMSREKQAQALAQLPGPRCSLAEQVQDTAWMSWASPRSWAQLGYGLALGSDKLRWARERFRRMRLIYGLPGFSSRCCFSNWLLPAETKPIYCKPTGFLIDCQEFQEQICICLETVLSHFSILSFILLFSLLFCSLKIQHSSYKLGLQNLIEISTNSGFTFILHELEKCT